MDRVIEFPLLLSKKMIGWRPDNDVDVVFEAEDGSFLYKEKEDKLVANAA